MNIESPINMNTYKVINVANGSNAQDAVAYNQLSTEASIRLSVDTALTNNLSTEISTRTSQSTTTSTNLSTEVSQRISGDTSLSTALSVEASIRLSTDATKLNLTQVQKSITYNSADQKIELEGDINSLAAGYSFYYGTDNTGTKGYHDLVSVLNSLNSNFLVGCRLIYDSDTTIKINSGTMSVRGTTVSRAAPLTLTWSDVDSGTTKQASSIYYVYIKVDPVNENLFVGFISSLAPTKDEYYNTIRSDSEQSRYHPTLDARFIGTFITDINQKIVGFRVYNNTVRFMDFGYNYLIQGAGSTKKTALNVRSQVPYTSNIAIIYYETNDASNKYKYIGDLESFIIRFQAAFGVEANIPICSNNIALTGTASVSSTFSGNATSLNDGEVTTNWTASTTANEWAEINFGSAKNLNEIIIYENGNNITSYNLQYYNGTTWVNFYTGTTIGSRKEHFFSTINYQRIRLYINTSSARPSINEMLICDTTILDSIYYKVESTSMNFGIHGYIEVV